MFLWMACYLVKLWGPERETHSPFFPWGRATFPVVTALIRPHLCPLWALGQVDSSSNSHPPHLSASPGLPCFLPCSHLGQKSVTIHELVSKEGDIFTLVVRSFIIIPNTYIMFCSQQLFYMELPVTLWVLTVCQVLCLEFELNCS